MLTLRKATLEDANLIYEWANDPESRRNSYNQELIAYDDHISWFSKKVKDPHTYFFIFNNKEGIAVGQIRIEMKEKNTAVISISIDKNSRGKGYAAEMIRTASDVYIKEHPNVKIEAYVFQNNVASAKSFLKAGYVLFDSKEIKSIASHIYHYN